MFNASNGGGMILPRRMDAVLPSALLNDARKLLQHRYDEEETVHKQKKT